MTLGNLLCFPYAGAGAGLFRTWPQRHPFRHTRVVPVQLPGREERFAEPPCESMADLVEACLPLALETAAGGPTALFGHSFGALVAYEVAQRLTAEGVRIERLVVSGAAAPWLPRPRIGVAELDDDALVSRVRALVGYDHPALHDPELRQLLLPSLRADLGITERYASTATAVLPAPVTALLGTEDELVSSDEAALWSKAGAPGSGLRHLPGGHMYFATDPGPLAATLDGLLAPDADG
ncbi:thioesterase II family protein [Streptomyces sp. NPDC017405]|uniref:thioesterase II family protein n=1 Tax=unclassified Streptomyces TaxID=2593676 RepID=UPI0037B8A121